MNRIDLKLEVQKAISGRWSSFEREHPRLASVLDEQLLVETATESIEDDPAFQEAMQQAALVGTAAETLHDYVNRFIQEFLRQLTG